MAKIAYVKETKEKNLLLGVVGEENSRYTITPRAYEAIGEPRVGCELDGETLSEIKRLDECYRAKKKALSLLALADNNQRTLTLKLRRLGYSRECVEDVVCEMVRLGYINEERQLERLVLLAVEKLWGPRKIFAHLSSKGFQSGDIRRAIESLRDSGEVDFDAQKMKLIEKKLPPDADAEEKKKLLYKNGF